MIPAGIAAQQLVLTKNQKEVQADYEQYIRQQFDQGIVDPLKVFLFLYKQYCDDGFNILFLYHTRHHVEFLKDVKIENMQQLLAHLDIYWGRTRIDPHTPFYMLCLTFFYYYGVPKEEYKNLRTIAKAVQTIIDNELEELLNTQLVQENVGDLFQLNMQEELRKKILTRVHRESESELKKEQKLSQNCVDYTPKKLMQVIEEFRHFDRALSIIEFEVKNILDPLWDRSIEDIKNFKNILHANEIIIKSYLSGKKYKYILYFSYPACLTNNYISKEFNLLAIIACFDDELNRHFINVLLKELNGDDEERLKLILSALCYTSIPQDFQKVVIDKLFALAESKKHTNIKKLVFKVFSCVNFNSVSKNIIIDRLLEYVNNQSHDTTLLNETLITLAHIDLSEYCQETLTKSLIKWPMMNQVWVCQILLKMNIPENYQYAVMQLLFTSIDNSADTIIALFPRLSAGQQIIWLLKLQYLASNNDSPELQTSNAITNLYCVLKYEYHKEKSTVVQSLNDINVLVIEKENRKILQAFALRAIKNVLAIVNGALAKKYPQIIDHALFMAVAYENIDLVKLLLSRNPNLNYIYNGMTALCLVAHNSKTGAEVSELLIANGADVELMNPLYMAVCEKNVSVVTLLLKLRPTIKIGECFHKSCYLRSDELIEIFIKQGVEINMPDSNGVTPLMHFLHGYIEYFSNVAPLSTLIARDDMINEKITFLLKKGAWDYQVYVTAVSEGLSHVLQTLISFMPPESRQQMLNDLLSTCRRTDMTECLINSGADIRFANLSNNLSSKMLTSKLISVIEENIKNKLPWHTSLKTIKFMEYVDSKNLENIISIIKLLPSGINFQDETGKTILHHFCLSKQVYINIYICIQMSIQLLNEGASLFVKDKQGKIPEDYLSECFLEMAVQEIEQQDGPFGSSNINLRDYIGKTQKSAWRRCFEQNYQKQILIRMMLFIAMIRQPGQKLREFNILPLDVINIILNHVAPAAPGFTDADVRIKYQTVSKSVATIFSKRNTNNLSSLLPVQELLPVHAAKSTQVESQHRLLR